MQDVTTSCWDDVRIFLAVQRGRPDPGWRRAAEIVRTASAQSAFPPDVLVGSLAYSHFELLFVDLVFYHRVLKCHVLVELKVDELRHEHLGQLNTYVNWYRKHEHSEGDNPPIGLLLCTRKNHALLEYALAGMGNQLFVSRYQLELPTKEELELVLEAELRAKRDDEEGSR